MPTIKDIAKAAGVSHGTVSNVLNKTGKVSTQKIRLVENAAKQLGYVPNAQAQLLRQGAANVVALILPSLREDTYLDLYLALQTALQCSGFDTSVYATDDIASNETALFERLPLSTLAAVVSVSCVSAQAAQLYKQLSCPVVFVNRTPRTITKNQAVVAFDFHAVGVALGGYALMNSWKNIAYFSAGGSYTDSSGIFDGLCDTVIAYGVSVQKFTSDANLIINKAFDIVYDHKSFDAIFTSDKRRAEALAAALRFSNKKRIPQIITVGTSKTFSDSAFATYELDYGQMGDCIAKHLICSLRGQKPFETNMVLEAKGFAYSFANIRRHSPQTLAMLTLESPATAALEKLSPMFESLSGISLKITSMPYDDLYAQIQMLSSSFSYDLIRMDAAWLDSMGKRVYLPLAELDIAESSWQCNLIQSKHGNYSHSGEVLCALPFDPSVQIFLYRSDLFSDATLCRSYYERYREPLIVPKNMAQFERVAAFFTQSQNPESPTLYGTTLTSGTAATAACDFLPYYLADGNKICSVKGEVQFNTPEMTDAMERYLRMKQYANIKENAWWRDSVRLFADGDTATATTFSNHASYIINSEHSNVVGKTGAAILPGGHPLLGGGVIGVSRHTNKISACRAFFNWFYTKDIASAMVQLGGTSPLTDAYSNFENDLLFPWLSTAKDSFEVGVRGDDHIISPNFSMKKYEYVLGMAVRNVINQSMTAKEAAIFASQMYNSKVNLL